MKVREWCPVRVLVHLWFFMGSKVTIFRGNNRLIEKIVKGIWILSADNVYLHMDGPYDYAAPLDQLSRLDNAILSLIRPLAICAYHLINV